MSIHKTTQLFSLILLTIVFSNCSSNEIGESKDVAQDKIYQQYSVKYSEGNDKANVFAQFRFAGPNGTTLVLSKPSQLAFDDEVIKVDSSGGSGAFYVLERPIANFYGKHHFIFTDVNNKKFDNDFSFDTVRLVNVPASASKKQGLNLSFEAGALQPGDEISISSSNTDSSFSFTVRHEASDGNSIVIPAKELMRQKNSEVKLEATLSRKINLQQNTVEGGELMIRYILKPVTVKLVD